MSSAGRQSSHGGDGIAVAPPPMDSSPAIPPRPSSPRVRSRFRARPAPHPEPHHHHHVYVVLLDPAVARFRRVRDANPDRDPAKPCVYVGMTGLSPEERLLRHRAGIQSAWVVKKHGLRLVPELYAHLNPMPFEAAARMEQDLAADLRRAGYTVTGGH